MASTNLEVVISARDQFTGTANRVIGTLHRMDGAAGRVGKGVGQLGLGLGKAGLIAAGAFATGIGAAAKAGMDFEDAFAGVRKTVEGTKPQLDGLGLELRALATRIPVKATDLAALAQEAGALGVPRAEVAKFTEVVSKLSAATTGLSTDVAAEAFGKLGNVLRVHGDDYARMASSLVALGNAGASSEADIIETAKRFGAAGAQAKLSAAQVLGFASAIASLGVEPEAAGSSLSRLFNNITKYIGTGNAKIKAFAATAGMSVKEFSAFFAKDASGAVQLFLKKLAGLDRFKASKVLKDAGITNVRDINAVLLLSQNYGELKRQLDLSTEAFAKNTALEEAAALRFDTFRSKFTLLKNSLTEAGLEVAEGLLPALGRAIDKFRAFLALDTTKSSLRTFGKDVGDAIDRIDWRSLIDSAKTVWDAFKPFAQAVTALPNEIKLAAAALVGLNKASGGLVGAGLGNIIGGLAGAATKGVAAKLPGIGRVFAQPVFVTNWPLGGMGGGPGAVGGKGGGLVGLGMTAVGAVAIPALLNEIWNGKGGLLEGLNKQAASNNNSAKSLIATGDVEAMQRAVDALRHLPDGLNPLQRALYDLNASGVKTHNEDMIAALEAAIAAQTKFKDNSYDAAEKIKGAANSLSGGLSQAAEAARKSYRLLVADRAAMEKARGRMTRIGFLGAGTSADQLHAANYLANRFAHSNAPFYRSSANAARTLEELEALQRRFHAKTGHDNAQLATDILLVKGAISALKTSSAHKSDEVKVQTTKAGQAVALAVRKKNLSVNLTTVTNVKVDGRNVASANYHYYGRDHQVPN